MAPPSRLSINTNLLPSLCALYPLADNGGGDAAYATLRPPGDPRSWIYFFEGAESQSLQRSHYSIAHFIWTHTRPGDDYDDLFGTDDDRSQAFADREGEWEFEPLEDPVVLRRRSWWLICALRDGNITDDLSRAPTLSDRQAERSRLPTTPHLAVYWLLAHWLLGNESAKRETDAAVASSSNVWVKAARRWIAADAPSLAVELRDQAPPKALEKGLTNTATATATATDDPAAQMARAPADLKLHAKVLANVAKSSDAAFHAQVETYRALIAGMSNFQEGKTTQLAWVRAIDERLLIPAIGLVQRSRRYPNWRNEHALRYVIGALGRLGPASPYRKLALETLLSARIDKLDAGRLAEIASALRPFREKRGATWLLRCAKAAAADRLGASNQEALFAALDALAELDRATVESLVKGVLAKSERLHPQVADVARIHGMKGLVPALASAFVASDDAPAEIGMALAVLAPAKGRELALRRAKKMALSPASQKERERLFGKKSVAAITVAGVALRLSMYEAAALVATFLVLDKTDTKVLATAKELLPREDAAPILRAFAAAHATEQLPLVRRHLRDPNRAKSGAAEYALTVLESS